MPKYSNYLDFLIFLKQENERYLTTVDQLISNRIAIFKLDGGDAVAYKLKNWTYCSNCYRDLSYYDFLFNIKDEILVSLFNSVIKPYEYLRLYQQKLTVAMAEYSDEESCEVYILKDLNQKGLRLTISKEDYENKIPKINQQYYRKG